jgi:hypothetical protein
MRDNDDPGGKRYYFSDVCDAYFREMEQFKIELTALESVSGKNNTYDTIEKSWEIKKEAIIKNIGVLCFSKDNADILIWSHYSNNHKGICFQYDAT